MIRPLTRQDFPAVRHLLQSANDAPYDIGVVAEEKCFGEGVGGAAEGWVVEEGGGLRGVAVRCGEYLRILAVDRSWRRKGIGSALLRHCAPRIIASEPGNYFTPGVWEEDEGTQQFLRRHGYGPTATSWNLHVDLDPRGTSDASAIQRPDTRVLDFVEEHFGAKWRFEVARAVTVRFLDSIGFAAVEANNRGLGSFGPTGVAIAARGHGHGRDLLAGALDDLRTLGYRRAIIPWTDALDYYRKGCGAKPAHRFTTYRR